MAFCLFFCFCASVPLHLCACIVRAEATLKSSPKGEGLSPNPRGDNNIGSTILMACTRLLHLRILSSVVRKYSHSAARANERPSYRRVLSRTLQHLEDMLGKAVSDLPVPGHWLRSLCDWVLIPVMPPPVTYKDASHSFDFSDKVSPFHATRSSPTL